MRNGITHDPSSSITSSHIIAQGEGSTHARIHECTHSRMHERTGGIGSQGPPSGPVKPVLHLHALLPSSESMLSVHAEHDDEPDAPTVGEYFSAPHSTHVVKPLQTRSSPPSTCPPRI